MAISTPVLIGTNDNKSANTSIAVTVGAGGVPAGATIFVGLAMSSASGAQAVTDTAGNTYALDSSVENANLCGLFWFRASNVSALVNTNTITASWTTNNTPEGILACYVTGLDATPFDQQSIDAGDENASALDVPDSGNITTTTNDQIIFGFLCFRGPVETVITEDADFTNVGKDGPTAGGFGSNRAINVGYRIVSATETNNYHPTSATASQWACGIASYKAAADGGRTGTMDATEAGADDATAAGVVDVAGALAAAEVGADVAALAGAVAITGTMAAVETGADVFVGSGVGTGVVVPPVEVPTTPPAPAFTGGVGGRRDFSEKDSKALLKRIRQSLGLDKEEEPQQPTPERTAPVVVETATVAEKIVPLDEEDDEIVILMAAA